MALFDEEIMEKVGKSDWLTGADFDGDGLVLKVVSVDKISSQYGADDSHSLVEKGILSSGQTFRYVFADAEGNERKFDSHSTPFMIAMNNAEFNFGDFLHITRTGKQKDTRYVAEKVDAPKVLKQTEYPAEDINPEDIPF